MGDIAGHKAIVDEEQIGHEAIIELMAHLISEPAFDQLRTKEQLGYIVHTAVHKAGGGLGLRMIVQSSHKDPEYLDLRVEEFLTGFRDHLAGLSDAELQTNITAVVDKLTEKPKNLDQETGRFWEEVRGGWALFDRRERVAAHLAAPTTTLARCVSFYDRYILTPSQRRKVSSRFYGKGTAFPKGAEGADVVAVIDPSAFKRSMTLQPVKTYF